MKKLTVEDLRNPERRSGFNYVAAVAGPSRGNAHPYFQAKWNSGGGERSDLPKFRGPARDTAEAAAQDYCDFRNGAQQSVGRLTVNLNRAGHHAKRVAKGALRRKRSGRRRQAAKLGYVYCIGEEGSATAVKIGYAGTPTLRIGSLQTGNPRKLVILGVLRGTKADERELHAEYQEHNILGEWFRPTARLLSEFDLEPEMIA